MLLAMAELPLKWWVVVLLFLGCIATTTVESATSSKSIKKTYIIYMDKNAKPNEFNDHKQWYASMIKAVSSSGIERQEDSQNEDRIVYHYQAAFHGVAAWLTDVELGQLQEQNGVMAVFPDETIYKMHTTMSPLFLAWHVKIAPAL